MCVLCSLVVLPKEATSVTRSAPVPSAKSRNRATHANNGNSSMLPGRTPAKRRANSLSNLSKRHKKKPTQKPVSSDSPHFSELRATRARPLSSSADPDWKQESPFSRTESKPVSSPISHSALIQLQQDAGLSDRQLRKVMTFHRKNLSDRRLYEPNFDKFLADSHRLFSEHFVHTGYWAGIPLLPVPMVICNRPTQFLQELEKIHRRKIRSIHHGVDSGKGFLKFDLTLEFEPDTPSTSDIPDHGRRRVIIIAILPDVSESIAVFKHVYDTLQLPVDQYFFQFHSDFKAICIATGHAGPSSSYPCPLCERKITVTTDRKQHLRAGKARTCASNRAHFKQLQKSGSSDHSQHASCSADPLGLFPQKSRIIAWCRLPSLHLFLFVNWFIHHIVRLYPSAADWYRHYHQLPSEYHSGDFQGPQLHRLTRSDSLQYLRELLTAAPPDALLFFDAMQAFVAVQHATFGQQLLPYTALLTDLRKRILLLPIRKLPLKLHVMTAHLKESIDITGRSLGHDAEQQLEAVHHDFSVVWDRFKVKDHTNKQYGPQLLRAVLAINAAHAPL